VTRLAARVTRLAARVTRLAARVEAPAPALLLPPPQVAQVAFIIAPAAVAPMAPVAVEEPAVVELVELAVVAHGARTGATTADGGRRAMPTFTAAAMWMKRSSCGWRWR
jgi:hypothetical protein